LGEDKAAILVVSRETAGALIGPERDGRGWVGEVDQDGVVGSGFEGRVSASADDDLAEGEAGGEGEGGDGGGGMHRALRGGSAGGEGGGGCAGKGGWGCGGWVGNGGKGGEGRGRVGGRAFLGG